MKMNGSLMMTGTGLRQGTPTIATLRQSRQLHDDSATMTGAGSSAARVIETKTGLTIILLWAPYIDRISSI
ncbi:unnamed protein product, partial [Linum tenue]